MSEVVLQFLEGLEREGNSAVSTFAEREKKLRTHEDLGEKQKATHKRILNTCEAHVTAACEAAEEENVELRILRERVEQEQNPAMAKLLQMHRLLSLYELVPGIKAILERRYGDEKQSDLLQTKGTKAH